MKFYTVSEACEYLSVSTSTLNRRMKSKKIAYRQDVPGGKLQFTEADMDKYIEKSIRRAEEPKPFTGQTLRKRRAR